MSAELSKLLNAIGLLAIGAVLALAFFDQVWFADLPCPLCILQRAGLIAAGIGIALNLTVGPRPSHYAMAIIGALASGTISIWQTLGHIVPGAGHYGNDVFGFHLYTWAFIAAAAIIAGCAVMLLDDRQFARAQPMSVRLKILPLSALLLFLALTVANIVSTVALCGAGACPDHPQSYELFGQAPG